MVEQRLSNIIDAADPDDGEDVAIRRLLVAALHDGGVEMTQHMTDVRRPRLLTACQRGAARHAGVMRSALLHRRCSPHAGRRLRR